MSLHDTPDQGRERLVLAAISVVALVALLYSVLIAQAVLAWFAIAIPLVVLYLLWRFVLAHERIAAALEADATDTDTTGASAASDDGE